MTFDESLLIKDEIWKEQFQCSQCQVQVPSEVECKQHMSNKHNCVPQYMVTKNVNKCGKKSVTWNCTICPDEIAIMSDNDNGNHKEMREHLEKHDISSKHYYTKILIKQKIQEEYSICNTCFGYLKQSKMPPMCSKNNLQVAVIPEFLKTLTHSEKQLMTKNLLFIKIRDLQPSQMKAINDRNVVPQSIFIKKVCLLQLDLLD